jgi:putative colanic acid biosysnthesis UDP-glucose lipid carrier transferase
MTLASEKIAPKRLDLQPSANRRPYAFVMKLMPGLQLGIDSIVLLVCGFVSYYSLVYYSYKTADFYNLAIFSNWILTIMLLYFADLYRFDEMMRVHKTIDRIIIAVGTSFALMIAAAFTIKISDIYSRTWIGIFFLSSVVGILIERTVVSTIIGQLGQRGLVARNLVVYGSAKYADHLIEYLEHSNAPFVRVAGIFLEDEPSFRHGGSSLKSNGNLDDLIEYVRKNDVEDVVVAMPWADEHNISNAVERLRELPANVFLSVDMVGFRMPLRQPPSYFERLPLFQVIGRTMSGWDVVLKTMQDYILGTIIFVTLIPLFLFVAILIKLDSPGPVIFRQRRLGFNNRVFNIYKFRTMAYTEAPAEKTIQATKNDTRITRLGRILRKTSIDELPQLWNVLNGTMSLVGPRPHAVDHNEEYSTKIRGYFARHKVKPGITGLAQIKGFRGVTDTIQKMEGRVKYDIEYADTWSLMLDIKILFITLFTAFWGRNAV